MVELAERITILGDKVDTGKFKYSEKQELDRLVLEYIGLESILITLESVIESEGK